jgi:hypothetical protein
LGRNEGFCEPFNHLHSQIFQRTIKAHGAPNNVTITYISGNASTFLKALPSREIDVRGMLGRGIIGRGIIRKALLPIPLSMIPLADLLGNE